MKPLRLLRYYNRSTVRNFGGVCGLAIIIPMTCRIFYHYGLLLRNQISKFSLFFSSSLLISDFQQSASSKTVFVEIIIKMKNT